MIDYMINIASLTLAECESGVMDRHVESVDDDFRYYRAFTYYTKQTSFVAWSIF